MVLNYYRHSVSPSRLRQILGTKRYGTPASNLSALSSLGIAVDYGSAANEQPLVDALTNGIPPICLVMTSGLPYWQMNVAHAVVVVAMDSESVLLNDPAFAEERQQVSLDAFLLAWSDYDYLHALLRRA